MFPLCSLLNFSRIFNLPKVLRFLDCGVLCLNFISMIWACSVTDSGFLECSCNVLCTSLMERCFRFNQITQNSSQTNSVLIIFHYLKDPSWKVTLKSKLGTTASENHRMIVFQNWAGTLECLYSDCITGLWPLELCLWYTFSGAHTLGWEDP